MIITNIFKINKNKEPFYDYIRVLATLLLIITHAIMMDLNLNIELTPLKLFFCKYISSITISCNVLFLFLSGALLLSSNKNENILEFYYKRCIRLLIPMLVYYLFYMFITGQVSFFPPRGFNIYLTNFLSGTVNEAPHMWILYQILAFYIICPFIKMFLQKIDYKTLCYLMIISFVCITLNVVCTYSFNMGFIFSNPLNQIFIIPVFGYFINKEESKKYYKQIMFLGIISLIVLFTLVKYNENYLLISSNVSPIAISIAATIYVFCKMFSDKLKFNYIIYYLSKYSFSIVLIHWYVISAITINTFHIHATNTKLLGIIPSLIISAIFAFIISLIFDNTIILLLNKIVNYVHNKLSKN